MTKAKPAELIEYYKDRCERYETMLEFVRHKCRNDSDMEFQLRKILKSFHATRIMPEPGTREHRELHGIPFD